MPATTIRPPAVVVHQRRTRRAEGHGVLVIRPAPSGDGWRVWDEARSAVRTLAERELLEPFPVVTGTAQEWWRSLGRQRDQPTARPLRRT